MLLLIPMPLSAARPIATPDGEMSLPMQLHQMPGAPVYYLIGLSGVPGTDDEGHTSNAAFVVTDDGGWFSMPSGLRRSATSCCSAASRNEDAERRLTQRREALFPWVDQNTRIVVPDETFDQGLTLSLRRI